MRLDLNELMDSVANDKLIEWGFDVSPYKRISNPIGIDDFFLKCKTNKFYFEVLRKITNGAYPFMNVRGDFDKAIEIFEDDIVDKLIPFRGFINCNVLAKLLVIKYFLTKHSDNVLVIIGLLKNLPLQFIYPVGTGVYFEEKENDLIVIEGKQLKYDFNYSPISIDVVKNLIKRFNSAGVRKGSDEEKLLVSKINSLYNAKTFLEVMDFGFSIIEQLLVLRADPRRPSFGFYRVDDSNYMHHFATVMLKVALNSI